MLIVSFGLAGMSATEIAQENARRLSIAKPLPTPAITAASAAACRSNGMIWDDRGACLLTEAGAANEQARYDAAVAAHGGIIPTAGFHLSVRQELLLGLVASIGAGLVAGKVANSKKTGLVTGGVAVSAFLLYEYSRYGIGVMGK